LSGSIVIASIALRLGPFYDLSIMRTVWLSLLVSMLSFCASFASETSSATLVLFNGTVVPMTSPDAEAQAIALAGSRILAIGTDEEVLALADDETRCLDLEGRTVLPGFVDPHTHLLNDSEMMGLSPQGAQRLALSYGITTAANLYTTPEMLPEFVAMAERGEIRLRMSLYLIHNTSCGESLGPWYGDFTPLEELAPRLRIGGIKIFAETSVCGDDLIGLSFSPTLARHLSPAGIEWYGGNRPLFTEDELSTVIRNADQLGFPVAIHAIGDAGVEVAIRSIEAALGGHENTLRHAVLHNLFIRDDLLASYSEVGIVAAVEPVNPCFVMFYNDLFPSLDNHRVRRWRDLIATGAHVAVDSDWPWCAEEALNPLFRLQAVTTALNTSASYDAWEPCDPLPPDQLLTPWQGLRAMTIDAAYMLHRDSEVGTLEPGKRADLVILSSNPLTAEAERLTDITVWCTLIDGKAEYCADDVAAADLPGPTETPFR